MNNNILITSAGKRVTLVRLFQAELQKLIPDAKVFTTDMVPAMAPAGHVSDGCFAVPRVTASDYMQKLQEICEQNKIGLIVPTIDTELLLLAQHKDEFLRMGVSILISATDFVQACRDKRVTADLLNTLNIRVPESRNLQTPVYPIFAKPYDGSLSKDLYVIRSAEDVTPAITENPKLIFMEYIDKAEYKEFTVDMYYGKDNKVKGIVPRERIEIRAGEINKGRAVKNHLLSYLKERMGYIPGVVGCICIQLFYRESDNDVVGIEINPRFGGGYPLSYHAGANFPKLAISEYLLGNAVDYDDSWHDNTLMLRYDAEVIIHG